MKRILFLMLLILPTISQGQDAELKDRILKLEENQEQIRLNLTKGHKQFSTGTFFLIGGVATTVLATVLYNKGTRNQNSDEQGKIRPSPVLLCIGGGMITAGTVIQIDSHKWIGRGGRKKK